MVLHDGLRATPGDTYLAKQRTLGREWRGMNPRQKQPYLDRAAELRGIVFVCSAVGENQ